MYRETESLQFIYQGFKTMKKNLSKLIVEVAPNVARQQRGTFKMTCQTAHKYTNKIMVDAVEYNKPTNAQAFISEEMKDYKIASSETSFRISAFTEKVKRKAEKPPSISYLLTQIQLNPQILMMQEVMCAIRFARKEQLVEVRPKLVKVENTLSFKLEEQDLEPHLQEALENFLTDLNEIINKATKAY